MRKGHRSVDTHGEFFTAGSFEYVVTTCVKNVDSEASVKSGMMPMTAVDPGLELHGK